MTTSMPSSELDYLWRAIWDFADARADDALAAEMSAAKLVVMAALDALLLSELQRWSAAGLQASGRPQEPRTSDLGGLAAREAGAGPTVAPGPLCVGCGVAAGSIRGGRLVELREMTENGRQVHRCVFCFAAR
jgi:hypothetical protein